MPAEPRLQAVASFLLCRDTTGRELSELEDAWLPLLEPFPWGDRQARGLRLRGSLLFGIGARLLGGDADTTKVAGEFWSLVDGAQHCSDEVSRAFLLDSARSIKVPARMSKQFRPLTILAAVAATELLERSTGPRRGIAATYHRLTGRFPRNR